MNDLDVTKRLHAAGEAVEVDTPPPEGAVTTGRRRSARRAIAGVTAALLIAGGTAWAVTELGGLRGNEHRPSDRTTFDPGRARAFQTPYGSEVAVPEGWFAHGIEVPGLELLDVTTNRESLHAAIHGCGYSDVECSTRNLEPADVGPLGAFVQVGVFSEPCDACTPDPPPDQLTPADFRPEDPSDDNPVMQYTTWIDDGSSVQVRYWIGAEASEANRQATEFLLGNLHLPAPTFNQADVHPFEVPYSGGDVPMPNGWTALSDVTAQSGYVLGLIASSDRAIVLQVHPCNGHNTHHYWCGVFGFNPSLAKPTEAMVRVDGELLCDAQRCAGEPLPQDVGPEDFHRVGVEAGGDLYELSGTAGGGLFDITYWIGPNASEVTREATLYLVSNLHLPRGRPLRAGD